MQNVSIVKPIVAGHRKLGTVGTVCLVLAEDSEHLGIMARLLGVKTLYAVAIPKDTLTDDEIALAEWLFDDATGSFYGRMAELIAAAPEGYVVTSADDTEVELIN